MTLILGAAVLGVASQATRGTVLVEGGVIVDTADITEAAAELNRRSGGGEES